jgi:restriction endonuclease S subunit
MGVVRANPGRIHAGYLFYQLTTGRFNDFLREQIAGANINNLSAGLLYRFQIPLPPLPTQKEIVAEIEGYQRIIDGARQVVENYKPQVKIDPAWSISALGEVCDVIAGQSPEGEYYNENQEGCPFYQGKTEFSDMYVLPPTKWTTQVTKLALPNDILMSVRAPVGPVNLSAQQICIGRGLAAIRPNKELALVLYIFYTLKSREKEIVGNSGSTFASINKDDIKAIIIPLPTLQIQQEIVAQIEKEQALVDASKQLISIYEQKIKDKIAEVWGAAE